MKRNGWGQPAMVSNDSFDLFEIKSQNLGFGAKYRLFKTLFVIFSNKDIVLNININFLYF